MLEIPDTPRPADSDVVRMCAEVELTPLPVGGAQIDALLDGLAETHANIGARLLKVGLGPHPVLDWFAARNDLSSILTRLLHRQEFRQMAPELFEEATDPDWIESGPPLTLAGLLAQQLSRGGAYVEYQGPLAEAMGTAERFCRALFDERYEDVLLYQNYQAWSEWFGDVAWDATYVLIDKRHRWMWLLTISDVD